jgi:uncharacterized protein YoxC
MDKTLTIDMNGTPVQVDTLPKPIRDHVDLFDKIREDIEELGYKITVLNHAAASVSNKVSTDASEYLNQITEAEAEKAMEEAKAKEAKEADTEKNVEKDKKVKK